MTGDTFGQNDEKMDDVSKVVAQVLNVAFETFIVNLVIIWQQELHSLEHC